MRESRNRKKTIFGIPYLVPLPNVSYTKSMYVKDVLVTSNQPISTTLIPQNPLKGFFKMYIRHVDYVVLYRILKNGFLTVGSFVIILKIF